MRRRIVRNFQILIVSAVKICKQWLQTASTAAYWSFDTGLHCHLTDPLGYIPKWKFLTFFQSGKNAKCRRTDWIQCRRQARATGLSPQITFSPSPTLKHTGQESGCDLCEIFEFWSFLILQSKYVNNVCKQLQLLVVFRPLDPVNYSPQHENSWRRHRCWSPCEAWQWNRTQNLRRVGRNSGHIFGVCGPNFANFGDNDHW